MKKKKRGWIWPVVIVVVLLAAGIIVPRLFRLNSANANAQLYEAVKVARGDMQVTVHGTGSIEAMDSKAVAANATAKVDTVPVENGDTVKKGDVIATLNADAVNDSITSLKQQIISQDATIANMRANPTMKVLYAPVDVRVISVYAKEGQDANVPMSAQGALMLLSTDGKMKVEFVPAAGTKLTAGSAVKIATGGKTLNGYISTVPDSTTDEAVAILLDDTYPVGQSAVIKDAKGAELGRGTLDINNPLRITTYSGTVDTLYVKAGDEVKSGHKLLKLSGAILDPNFNSQLAQRQKLQDDLNKAYDNLKDYTITAPEDGIVTDLAIQENGAVQDGMTVCTIQQTSGFKLVVAVDELDIPSIKLGQKATVKIDALPGQDASAVVDKISPIGIKSNDVTTYDVTLKVTAPAGALDNMSASADIETAFKANALTIPIEALHTVDGKTFVYGALAYDQRPDASGNSTGGTANSANPLGGRFASMFGSRKAANDPALQRQTIEVTVGLISDSSAEILSGLNEGDEIAVPVAQDTTANSMFSMGGGRNTSRSAQPAPSAAAGNTKN